MLLDTKFKIFQTRNNKQEPSNTCEQKQISHDSFVNMYKKYSHSSAQEGTFKSRSVFHECYMYVYTTKILIEIISYQLLSTFRFTISMMTLFVQWLGWSWCLLLTWCIKEFHFAIIKDSNPALVEVAHQYTCLHLHAQIPFIQSLMISQPFSQLKSNSFLVIDLAICQMSK